MPFNERAPKFDGVTARYATRVDLSVWTLVPVAWLAGLQLLRAQNEMILREVIKKKEEAGQ